MGINVPSKQRFPQGSTKIPTCHRPLLEQSYRARVAKGAQSWRKLTKEERAMLGWALTFLIVALVAAVLGFGGIAGFAVEIAKIIFFVAIILFVISAIFGLMRGRSPTVP